MVASIDDIACMKLDAVSSRGTKRDFIDLYFIAKERPLPLLLGLFQERYGDVEFSLMHIKKSLVYFEDGESDPMPAMLMPVTWSEVKQFFLEEVPRL